MESPVPLKTGKWDKNSQMHNRDENKNNIHVDARNAKCGKIGVTWLLVFRIEIMKNPFTSTINHSYGHHSNES